MTERCSLTDLAIRFGWRNYLGEPDPEVVGRVIEHEHLLGNLPVGRRDSYVVGSPELDAIIRMFVQLERSRDRVDEDRPRRKRKKERRIIMATVEAETRKSKRKARGVQEGEVVTPRATRQAPENMVTIRDLAKEFGYQPQYLRKLLRDAREAGDFEHTPRTRYQWERDSEELDAVRNLIQRHVDNVAAAELEGDDEDSDSDEDLDFDEE